MKRKCNYRLYTMFQQIKHYAYFSLTLKFQLRTFDVWWHHMVWQMTPHDLTNNDVTAASSAEFILDSGSVWLSGTRSLWLRPFAWTLKLSFRSAPNVLGIVSILSVIINAIKSIIASIFVITVIIIIAFIIFVVIFTIIMITAITVVKKKKSLFCDTVILHWITHSILLYYVIRWTYN